MHVWLEGMIWVWVKMGLNLETFLYMHRRLLNVGFSPTQPQTSPTQIYFWLGPSSTPVWTHVRSCSHAWPKFHSWWNEVKWVLRTQPGPSCMPTWTCICACLRMPWDTRTDKMVELMYTTIICGLHVACVRPFVGGLLWSINSTSGVMIGLWPERLVKASKLPLYWDSD